MSDELYDFSDMPPETATVAPTVEEPHETPKKKRRRRGAPAGNLNAMQHGLTVPGVPPGCRDIQTQVDSFKTALEVAVEQVRGTLGVYEAACCQTAVEWHTYALKARRWVALEGDKLTIDQRISFSKEVARGFTERDRVLKLLGLDFKTAVDAATVLYANEAKSDANTANSASETHSKGAE